MGSINYDRRVWEIICACKGEESLLNLDALSIDDQIAVVGIVGHVLWSVPDP